MKNKKKVILLIIGIMSLVLVTVGVTFAVFTYTKLGTTENTVTTGTLKFLYTENTGVGNGISIENAFPVSDEVGKGYNTDKYVFDFSVESTNSGTEEIPYEVTLRKKDTSSLAEKNVKIYLTDMTEDADTAIVEPTLYSDLSQTIIDVGDEIEKTIYTGEVAGGELTYLKDFRLRMWIDEKSNQDDINGKTFTALVNVYSNVPLVSEEEINLRSNAEISSISVGDTELTTVEGQDYDYETTVTDGSTEITFDIETKNPNSTVTIEKVDSIAYSNTSNIERMAVSKTLSLTGGNNYFKVTVTSQNNKVTKSYYIKVYVVQAVSLSDAIFDTYNTIYENATLTDSSNNTSDASGLYKSTATNDKKPTYYFRGAVENNYVEFAGVLWRIVRINEDGTIRLVLNDSVSVDYFSPTTCTNANCMYYTNSKIKGTLESWYTTNVTSKGLDTKVATGDYYCQQAKVSKDNNAISGNDFTMVLYSKYTPTFECTDINTSIGIINSNIGLLSYDEMVHAGAYPNKKNINYYLHNDTYFVTMSPAGFFEYNPYVWESGGSSYSMIKTKTSDTMIRMRPVINLKVNTFVSGFGTSTEPWKII